MKRILLLTTVFIGSLAANTANAQTRYLDEVSANVTVTQNVSYGNNIQTLNGDTSSTALLMDIYEPTGDSLTDRPLIVIASTGSFFPKYFNGLTTGDKGDSATVEICSRLAKQGYVVAAINYRKGWNPAHTEQAMRAESIIQAVYRGMQDAKTCVRYFRKDVATNSNSYGIDDTRIAIGGQGSGGYISLAYASLDKLSEIQAVKFFNTFTNELMVDTAIMGDFSGIGGDPTLNISNHVGYSDDVLMAFNIGGAMGDSSWINAGEMPIVSFHGVSDIFAPFDYGMVIVPSNQINIVEVSGSSSVNRYVNALGNNNVLKTPAISDVYTTAANSHNTAMDAAYGNAGGEGLFPFIGAANGNSPWEWWDDNTVTGEVTFINTNFGTSLVAANILSDSYQSNPFAGATRAKAYIDTIQGYLSPRLYRGLFEQPLSVEEFSASEVSVYPNPATDNITFVSEDNNPISSILFYSLEGKVVRTESNINATNVVVSNLDLPKGIYFASVRFKEGATTKKVVIK